MREAPERGHAGRVAQRDVVLRRGGLVLCRPYALDSRPAARRRAGPADRCALRAAGREGGAHRPVGTLGASGEQGPRAVRGDARPRRAGRDPADSRPHPAGRGRAGRVPLPSLLRARRDRADRRAARGTRVPGRAPRRGADHRDRGLRAAGRGSHRVRGVRTDQERLPRPAGRPLPYAARDDRQRPAGRRLRREPRRCGSLVHGRLRGGAAGDAVHVQARRAADHPVELAEDLRPQSRDGRRALVADQPLGEHGPDAAAFERGQGQHPAGAGGPLARLRAASATGTRTCSPSTSPSRATSTARSTSSTADAPRRGPPRRGPRRPARPAGASWRPPRRSSPPPARRRCRPARPR